MPSIDAGLAGGLRRGHLSEVIGGRSSGRSTVVCRALAAAVSRGELVALVDTCDRFDPDAAAALGLDLSNLLWIREAGDASRALKAMNLVLQAGGFGLVVLDLADVAPRTVRSLPFTTWFRLARVIEGSDTVALLMAGEHVARSSGGATIAMHEMRARARRDDRHETAGGGRRRARALARQLGSRAPPARHRHPATRYREIAACRRSSRACVLRACRLRLLPWRKISRHGCSATASDSVVLDVGGLGRLLGEPPIIAEELDRAMRLASDARSVSNACSASKDSPEHAIGVAPTQIAAMLLSSARPGVAVATDDVPAALAPLRLETLRHVVAEMHGGTLRRGAAVTRAATFWESAEKAFEVAERWGLTTIGEFAALPAGALASRLGQVGNALQGMARGVDASPLVPDPDVPRFFERVELEWPIDGLEPLAFVLARLLEPLSASLERADRGAAAIHLELRLVDRTMHTRVLQLPVAMRDAKVLRTLLVLDLESHPPHAAIDIVTVEVDPAPGRVIQYSLLERARPSAETLATLTARLDALVGQSRCGQPVLLDSHGPDAFELRRFAPDETSRRTTRGSSRSASRASDRRRRAAPISAADCHSRHRRTRPPAPCLHRSPWDAGRHGRAVCGAVALIRRLVERSVTAMESRRMGRGAERRLGLPVVPGARDATTGSWRESLIEQFGAQDSSASTGPDYESLDRTRVTRSF